METRLDGTYQNRQRAIGMGTLFALAGLIAMAAMATYFTVRVVLLVRARYSGIEIVVSVALITAEMFVVIHAFGYVLSVLRALFRQPSIKAAVLKDPEDFPPVDILVAARHEPREILERTLASLVGLHYPNKTIWLLDDSSDPRHVEEAAELARTFNAKLFKREQRSGAKAGIINACLERLEGKYITLFDADQCPMPFFLNRIVPVLEADSELAFVQTPQFYANINVNRVARAAGAQQAVFYEYICEAKASAASAFCCGTNVVFRRDALAQAGGLDENSVTEDFATSVKIHAAGWKSLYYGEAYTMGLGPETLPAYFRQQYRWARGTLGVGLQLIKRLVTAPASLSFWQWIDYGLSSTFYLVGWAYLILMLCPVLYVGAGIPSYFVQPEIYFLAFMPYLLFAVFVFIAGLHRRRYTVGQMLQGVLLVFLAAPVHIRASLAALFGRRSSFGVTPKGLTKMVGLKALWPQITICVANYLVFLWGISQMVFEKNLAAGINGFWAGIHFAAFCSVFYFREAITQDEKSLAAKLEMETAS